MENAKKKLMRQISDAAGNVLYTYDAHWVIVNRLRTQQAVLKITQICLTALSTRGFLASLIAGIPELSWVGGFTSAIALGLNLYSLNFNLPTEIKSHTDAANDLWDVREDYKSLLCDFEELSNEEIRIKRNYITQKVSQINKKYPGTDNNALTKAQENIKNYMFDEGESAMALNIKVEEDE